jgi:hypothetical protein
MRVSNSQRSLYTQCAKKYQFRYINKLRSKAKGSALFMGTAFDQASDVLLHQKDLQAAKERFSEMWMAHEQNLNCKFSKTDLDLRILESSDIARLEAAAGNLNTSEAKKRFDKSGAVETLIKDIKKMKEQSFMRDLTLEEERFLHYAHILSMLRKGFLMLEAFYKDILPKITKVISTQTKVDVSNGQGDEILGYIDLLCEMEGSDLPNGRKLTNELIVADVKTAGVTYWGKLDDLEGSDQLDTYLASPQVQSLQATNLVAYLAVSKQVSADETYQCQSCGNVKSSSHKTCNAEVEGKRCGGDWKGSVKYFCQTKIVIGERDLNEAVQVYQDYDHVVRGIKAEVFPRNREACTAYGAICEFKSICGKCYSSDEQEQQALEDWKSRLGE